MKLKLCLLVVHVPWRLGWPRATGHVVRCRARVGSAMLRGCSHGRGAAPLLPALRGGAASRGVGLLQRATFPCSAGAVLRERRCRGFASSPSWSCFRAPHFSSYTEHEAVKGKNASPPQVLREMRVLGLNWDPETSPVLEPPSRDARLTLLHVTCG